MRKENHIIYCIMVMVVALAFYYTISCLSATEFLESLGQNSVLSLIVWQVLYDKGCLSSERRFFFHSATNDSMNKTLFRT